MTRQTTTPLPQLIYPRVIHLRRRLKDLIYKPITGARADIQVGPVHHTFISWEEAVTEKYESIRVGDSFSPASVTKDGVKEFPWTQRWFRIDLQFPPDVLQKGNEYCLYFLAHGEFTVYTNTGDVWCGIDPVHDRIPISSLLQGEQSSTTIWLDGGQWQTGFWFGLEVPTDELGFRLLKVDLQQKSILAKDMYHDLSMLVEWVEYTYGKENIPLNTENGYYHPLSTVPPSLRRILNLLNQACDLFDRTQSLSDLGKEIKFIYGIMTTSSEDMKICHVGHAHMDLVWLWPERVTYQKIIHTYSNVLQLMNKYPAFTFTMSQPPLYHHIQKKQPKLAEQIKKKIQSGRWEFTGALEVEADTQIPVGEGLVRCILYGQERIKATRGSVSDTVWIPDVFGYSQCLPQIFFLAEIPNFFTTKILWSTLTKFPHNSFVWIGPDGESSVLTHLSVTGYNSKITMKEAMVAVRNYQQADVHDEVLCPSGYGDGGGGPSEDQVERSLRMQRSFIGETPSCRWDTVDSFFQRLSLVKDDLPMYRGELFLEYHRAVHTTQSDFKYNLRNCERALQTREALRVISGNFVSLDMAESWERYLFALFHDATPGSSIHSVYQELNAELKLLAERQYESAVEEWPQQPAIDTSNIFTIVNPLAWTRYAIVEVPEDLLDGDHSSHIVHSIEDNVCDSMQLIDGKPCALVKLEGLSAKPYTILPKSAEQARGTVTNMEASPTSLSNGIVNAEFDKYGQLCSISIRGEPLLITKDEAASFTLHDDNPEAYDAWDMDHHIVWMKDKVVKEPVTLKVVACGHIASILRSEPIPVGANGSTMEIEYRLYPKQDSLHVSCFVDWKESHKTLRYQIPTEYRGDVARFGAPFNFVDRSQIPQTHKEEGQWEVPASRWASILNGNCDGLSIITQAKYGFRAKLGTLSLSLLRSSTFPDPTADQGKHNIQFAITRHQNTFQHKTDGDLSIPTAAKADELFTQPIVLSRGNSMFKPATKPCIQFTSLGSAVPSWTMPSKSEGLQGRGFCIRLHEVSGANTNVLFSIPVPNGKMAVVESVNLNEKSLTKLNATSFDSGNKESSYNLSVTAYKIVTLRVLYF
mmetsp:Transcript_14578/g.31707  ORF Transcript_14578/g.31707 Transcript_14578/m.31707 type:complete len:1092 (+) Transcript_14578:117-3392(+)|eukprot:CAMPEP_0172315458 /NCGR_PEP_ID=MMETSP1058-20130122/25258_1 /TAXON_ID=83371 /ORGANISM="Detonula confervacea, Strain CCMP 353" /LENGTH=1091 /DNA_ID=CAMNT_0013029535 /DNA_START=9 /DNA_END=3284 /DNA_ORIENTATION=+